MLESYIKNRLAEKSIYISLKPFSSFIWFLTISIIGLIILGHMLGPTFGFLCTSIIATLMFTTFIVSPHLTRYEMNISSFNIANLFDSPAITNALLVKVVKDCLDDKQFNNLVSSPNLLADFRVGLYKILKQYDNFKDSLRSEDVESLVRSYTTCFAKTKLR